MKLFPVTMYQTMIIIYVICWVKLPMLPNAWCDNSHKNNFTLQSEITSLCHIHTNIKLYIQNTREHRTSARTYAQFWFACSRFYRYTSGLFHWYWRNDKIVPVPMNRLWSMSANQSRKLHGAGEKQSKKRCAYLMQCDASRCRQYVN